MLEMSPQQKQQDEEQFVGTANGDSSTPRPITPYRDSPHDSDDDEDDAPLRPRNDVYSPGSTSWQTQLSNRVPLRLKNAWHSTITWVKGPQPPRIYKITPIIPKLQHAPIELLDRYAPKRLHLLRPPNP